MITVARKRRPKSKNYFTKDTENAIVRYNNEPNPEIRSNIYRDEIHYAFFKLTENIIHTFKFYYTEVCLLYTSPSPRDRQKSRMPSSA